MGDGPCTYQAEGKRIGGEKKVDRDRGSRSKLGGWTREMAKKELPLRKAN